MSAIADSCALVVFLADPDPDPRSKMPNAYRFLTSEAVYVPLLVVLEMGRKAGGGGLPLIPVDLSDILREHGFLPLPTTWEVAETAAKLPPIHKDPIDRALVAHPMVQRMPILTSDQTIPRYGVPTIW